ncbi:hypothetical protein G9C98_001521 [Cotesia typhae]|uniref:Uncharacterized protein n=1 Tax=Cotesia typhae TaxID=2053667 RepID=A0A8J5QSP2_9HYME|nr:hypothetical protein G9C98_001521 [Cotesia typhae]
MKAQFHQALEKQKLRTRQYDNGDPKENNLKNSNNKKNSESSTESSITGSPDSTDYTSDEYLRLPDKISPTSSISTKVQNTTEYLGLNNVNVSSTEPRKYIKQNNEKWTEISLNNSPDDIYYNNEMYSDEDDQIPYKPLPSELSPESIINTSGSSDTKDAQITRSPSIKSRGKLDSSLTNWITKNSAVYGESSCTSGNSARRQSLDMLWNTGTGERMKELLNHGMMMLNISSLTERRSSKVPSPLEKTMNYLNPDEETSDSESLASVEMLSEDQISSLMMEPDINQVCQEVLGTPLVEVCPLLQQLQQ